MTFVLLFLCLTSRGLAQSLGESSPVIVDLPLLDLPFNQSAGTATFPSMRQSLALSTDFYEGLHRAIGGEPGTERSTGRIWWLAGFDVLSGWIPLGSGWMHEEWHRGVLSRRGYGSFNGINEFPIGRSLISVSRVQDQDLIDLKREHNSEQVRLSAAGMESQIAQNNLIEQHHFFNRTRTFDGIVLWMNAVNVTSYLSTCDSGAADSATDDQNREDGSDVAKRDFTGLDCTAWVYDLFRPDEPYQARGAHPSGVGLNRYIHHSDLRDKEKAFLHEQMLYSLTNFVDPFLFGKDFFSGRWGEREFKWNANLSHSLTAFGGTVDANLFLQVEEQKFLFVWHNGMTDTRYWPGWTLEWREIPLPLLRDDWSLTTSVTVWNQPRDQRVEETVSETLFAARAQLNDQVTPRLMTYLGVESKTPGWLRGNVYLDRNISTWAGLRVSAF